VHIQPCVVWFIFNSYAALRGQACCSLGGVVSTCWCCSLPWKSEPCLNRTAATPTGCYPFIGCPVTDPYHRVLLGSCSCEDVYTRTLANELRQLL
jgi:hypothetical protein